jgi:hypothetical protein
MLPAMSPTTGFNCASISRNVSVIGGPLRSHLFYQTAGQGKGAPPRLVMQHPSPYRRDV